MADTTEKSWLRRQAGYFFKRKPPWPTQVIRGLMLTFGLIAAGAEFLPGRETTAGERQELATVFQDSVDIDNMVFHSSKLGDVVMERSGGRMGHALSDKVAFHSGVYSEDFSTVLRIEKFYFLHEAAHVWQFQNCYWNTFGEALTHQIQAMQGQSHSDVYDYELTFDKDLLDYNIEQQASIIAEYFLLRNHGFSPHMTINEFQNTDDAMAHYEAVLANFLNDPGYARGHCSKPPAPGGHNYS